MISTENVAPVNEDGHVPVIASPRNKNNVLLNQHRRNQKQDSEHIIHLPFKHRRGNISKAGIRIYIFSMLVTFREGNMPEGDADTRVLVVGALYKIDEETEFQNWWQQVSTTTLRRIVTEARGIRRWQLSSFVLSWGWGRFGLGLHLFRHNQSKTTSVPCMT